MGKSRRFSERQEQALESYEDIQRKEGGSAQMSQAKGLSKIVLLSWRQLAGRENWQIQEAEGR